MIGYIAGFADEEAQREVFLGDKEYSYSYDEMITKPINYLFDDEGGEDAVKQNKPPYHLIGVVYKTREEAEAFLECMKKLDIMLDALDGADNKTYLESKEFKEAAKAAKVALAEMAKNELLPLERIGKYFGFKKR